MAEPTGSTRPTDQEAPTLDDRAVPRRMFLFIGGFMVFLAVLYWFTAYEDAGTVMLALSAVLALWFGTYLWLQQRRAGSGDDAVPGEAPYLPAASAWPFAIGLGAATVANGLVIGGYIHQSRHRY
jgi:hypothetical protein